MQKLQKISKTRLFILSFILTLSLPITAYLSPGSLPEPVAGKVVIQEAPIFGEIWARTELYFGTARPDGSVVSDDKFKRFLDTEITPRFPDGLTQISGFGQYRNSKGAVIQEKSKIVILLYP